MTAKANRSMAGELVRFSLPLILSGILQQLYSWADAFIVGHAEGELQLGAIGATHSISYFFINTILGFTLGLSIMAAQEYGRGNYQKVRRILACFLPVLCGAYTLLSACGMLLAEPILRAMDTPGEIFDYSLQYLRIVFMGIPFLSVYNLYAALLRAVGNTKLSFYAVLLSSGLNILLDVLLVKKVSRVQVAGVVGKYKDGRYKELPHLVRHYRTKSVKITCDKPTPINLDGELRMAQEVTMSVSDKRLRFFYPRGLTWAVKEPAEV